MALGSIVIDLLLKTGAFETDTKKAERRLKEMEKTAKRVGAAIGTAIVGGVTAATYAIRSQIQAMDDLSKAALRAHMPTEEFSQLAYAGSLADVEMGNLVTSMGRLARAQADAQRGLATQTDAFRKLGIEFEDANGKVRAGMDVLKDFADVVRRRKGDPEVLAAGMQVFGRSFQNLIPLLSQGREGLEAAADEADRLGYTLDTQAGQQAEEFNDNLARLQTGIQGVWRAVAADLLPDLVRLTDEMVRSGTEGDKLASTATKIADGIRVIADAAMFVGRIFNVAGNAIATLTAYVDALYKSLHGLLTFNWAKLREGINLALIGTTGFMENTGIGMPAPERDLSPIFAGEGPEPAGLFRMSEAELAMQRAREAAAEAAEAARKEAEARAAASAAAAAGAKQRAEAEKALAEAIREVEEADRKAREAEMAAEQYRLDWLNRIDDLTASVDGQAAVATLEFRRALAEANAALATGVITMDEYQKYAQALGQRLSGVVAEVDTATGEMTVFAEQAARNMQDAFADFLFDPFDGGIKGMVSSFAEALRKMAAQAAASEIFKAIGNWAGGTGTGWGAALSAILKGTRANGGNVASGGTYLVGERGPELLRMGPRSGTIVPNHALGGGAAQGVKVEIINNTGAEVRTESGRAPDGAVLERIIIGAVNKHGSQGALDGLFQQFGAQRKGIALG